MNNPRNNVFSKSLKFPDEISQNISESPDRKLFFFIAVAVEKI